MHTTAQQQRDELHKRIWKMANEVRGAVSGWEFKQYVLGALFYRFISENFTAYIEGDDESVDYASFSDNSPILEEIKDDTIKTKGYFIYPSQLFQNVVKNATRNPNLNTDLKAIFQAIENSATGYASKHGIEELFKDFDTTSSHLGKNVEEKNQRLTALLKGVEELDFGSFEESQIDLFGDAYEFLISNYAANAGKSGGEFFTPQTVAKLLAKLALYGQAEINKVYDPAAGSGSLLLQVKKQLNGKRVQDGYFGQEVNLTTYNLARMNMFLHGINYSKFNLKHGDTLKEPEFKGEKPFDIIVSNPPYSIKWDGEDDPTLINDERFSPASVLAPKSYADFAFILHSLSYLSSRGRAAIVCFPGVFYRGGAEQKIRQYLVNNNFIETIITLPSHLFFGTTIATNILILSKSKAITDIQFIDASNLFEKVKKNNVLRDEHIEQILSIFINKTEKEHFSRNVSIAEIEQNNFNLSVSTYIEPEDTREVIDIHMLNEQIRETVLKIDGLRKNIDAIIEEIEA